MPTIEVSDAVYDGLKARAIPFDDTPNSVIERLLDLAAAELANGNDAPRPVRRAVVGTILPEREYELPILRALIEAGGSAPAGQVTDRVGELLDGRLTAEDFQRHRSGDVRWRNRTAFARLNLVRRGLLAKTSPRGIWEITDEGRDHARRNGVS